MPCRWVFRPFYLWGEGFDLEEDWLKVTLPCLIISPWVTGHSHTYTQVVRKTHWWNSQKFIYSSFPGFWTGAMLFTSNLVFLKLLCTVPCTVCLWYYICICVRSRYRLEPHLIVWSWHYFKLDSRRWQFVFRCEGELNCCTLLTCVRTLVHRPSDTSEKKWKPSRENQSWWALLLKHSTKFN